MYISEGPVCTSWVAILACEYQYGGKCEGKDAVKYEYQYEGKCEGKYDVNYG